MEEIKIENKTLGTMYLDLFEEERIKLLDSNKNYVGYICYLEFEKGYIEEIINKLSEIKHISEIVDLGFCNNMIFGKSVDDLAEVYQEYINHNSIFGEEINLIEAKEEISSYINVIGDNYFLVDYDEL